MLNETHTALVKMLMTTRPLTPEWWGLVDLLESHDHRRTTHTKRNPRLVA